MKITLYMAMTLNGYIATETDETPWSDAIWKSYYRVTGNFKALIIGRRTYEIMQSANEFEKLNNPFTVVMTTQKLNSSKHIVTAKSPSAAIKILKKKNFAHVLLGGGGQANRSFMKAGLIDEIILDIEPVLFGKGIRLFAEDDFQARLKLRRVQKLPGDILQLHYAVMKNRRA